mmetsp:Transcript_990/g.2011  ORF Transcript_990/g.2011 Transcript_990/m.2011 type:complete len:234 (-) Transcript_990:3027-3728(-)
MGRPLRHCRGRGHCRLRPRGCPADVGSGSRRRPGGTRRAHRFRPTGTRHPRRERVGFLQARSHGRIPDGRRKAVAGLLLPGAGRRLCEVLRQAGEQQQPRHQRDHRREKDEWQRRRGLRGIIRCEEPRLFCLSRALQQAGTEILRSSFLFRRQKTLRADGRSGRGIREGIADETNRGNLHRQGTGGHLQETIRGGFQNTTCGFQHGQQARWQHLHRQCLSWLGLSYRPSRWKG